MQLALFDLDNTLIAGDSDYAWGEFLVRIGKVDAETYQTANARFYEDYRRGRLDIHAYLRFALAPLAATEPAELEALRERFMAEVIDPLWLPRAERLVREHRERGHRPLIVTATNRFVVEPICRRLGIADIIATEPELVGGRFTGAVRGEPSFGPGKVSRVRLWLGQQGLTLAGSHFYSDSINDLPLLEVVEHPVAVDPDAELAELARRRGWPIISLRD
ncbi:MAG: HAD family hydrolase [Pseudomonadota bacterium]|jgi:HAD superfamily hydrolase (TIGR01490 family)